MNKLAVIGFDGLDPSIVEKHLDRLPNIKSLIQEGFFGKLRSTIPPITTSAWTSMVTGLNPGKTGILGFSQKVEGEKIFKSVALADITQPKIWDVVTKYNGKSVILNIPLPSMSKVNGIYTNGRFGSLQVYPSHMKEIIEKEGYSNRVVDIINSDMTLDELYEDVLDVEYKRFKVGMKLIEEQDPDFVFFVFNIPDAIHHVIDDENLVEKLYIQIDGIIGEFLDKFRNLFIVSDHGMSSKQFEYTFNFLGWLVENGLSKVDDKKLKSKMLIKKLLSAVGLYKKDIPRELSMLYYDIDWDKSAVYTEPNMPVLYINDKCKTFLDKDDLFRTLTSKFEKINYKGKQYHFKLYKREDLYSGDNLSLLPEIIIDAPEELVFRDTISKEGIFTSPRVWKRNHSKYLTFIGRGDMIKAGAKVSGSIYDICPTILCSLGIPLLADTDGEILDVFSADYEKNYTDEYIELEPSGYYPNESEEDEEEIKQRLKNLGYL